MIGSTLETGYKYDAEGQGELIREPKLDLNNNNSGKAEDIYLFTGQRPQAAFGNSTGDREMLEWTTAGDGRRLGMLVLHDDAEREYAYGPANGLPDTKVGTFTQALMDEAKQRGWVVISMKNDWKTIFAAEAVKATRSPAELRAPPSWRFPELAATPSPPSSGRSWPRVRC